MGGRHRGERDVGGSEMSESQALVELLARIEEEVRAAKTTMPTRSDFDEVEDDDYSEFVECLGLVRGNLLTLEGMVAQAVELAKKAGR
uniref:Uncharacterized protein n=2 Tax=Myxococcus fulvus TaxID=33 RepID=B0YR30_MYXFU|nr:hypothetical protein pMF1.21 [Myxococcus fulvus]